MTGVQTCALPIYKLIKIHPTLTKSDLILRNGTISETLKTISSKLGITVKELKEEIDKF